MTPYKPKILVVDDEENILEVLQLLLERGGYEVWTAMSPVSALELLRTQEPDLIISDVNMPGMDGYAFFQQVQSRPGIATVPFLFLTARGGKEDMLAGKELGADDYLVKPLTGEELLASVRGKLKRVAARAAQQREQVDTLKREILNVLSHEFVTPLVSIKGTTDLLLSEDVKFEPDELKNFLSSIRRGGDRLGKLVEDFILSAKVQAGSVKEEADLLKLPTDLRPLVRLVVERWKTEASAKGIEIVARIPEVPVEAEIYDEHIKGVIERLVDNAVKYSAAGASPIEVALDIEGASARLSVRDRGIGIDASQLAEIFRPFHQINRKSMEQQGPGLGLSLARGLAEANRGELAGTSNPGSGSTFVLTLPLKEA